MVNGTAGPSPTARPVDFLHDVSRQLAGSLNVRRTVLNALHLAVPRLADWVLLAQFDGDGARLTAWDGRATRTATVAHLRDALPRIRRVGQTELLHVSLDDPVEDLATLIPDPALRADAAELRPADVLGVALTSHGTTLGALVAVRGHGRGYDEPEVRLVEEFAGRVAVTLDAARLYEERTHIANTLQAGLRPPELPALPGMRIAARYRAAHERMDIGGDFYDVHGAPDDVCAVIGDVCGKGVEAAVLTGKARQTVKTAALFDRSPSVILAALNDVLSAEGSDRFVTVACARLRPDGDGTHVTLAVAGHPPPLVVRRDGTVEDVAVRGTVAGVWPNLTYEEVGLRLGPGDTMLLFTDGVFEARNRGDFFGMTRLRALLAGYAAASPETMGEAVEQRVVEHLDGAEHDDIALLAIQPGD